MKTIKTIILLTALVMTNTYACEQIADQHGNMYYVGNDCHRGAYWSGRD